MPSPPAGFDISCVVHVHSTYSDGSATVPELLSAAREAGADAVLLSDHDTLGARRDGWEGLHDGVFLLVGIEISPKQGHYLAFGVEEEPSHVGRTAVEIAAAVRAAGGVGFAAHPFSTGGHMLVPSLARRIVLPHGWPSARRRVPAIGGLDGHAPGIRVRGRVRSPLSHARTFGLLRTHLIAQRALSGDLDLDRATLTGALADGSAWLSCPFVAPAEGARLWAEAADGTTVPMGGAGRARPATLRLRLPRAADIEVFRDGSSWHAAHGARVDLDVREPGAYRVEARLCGRLWLLSNPVHLRSRPQRPVAATAADAASSSSPS